jgi:hypothetical protein
MTLVRGRDSGSADFCRGTGGAGVPLGGGLIPTPGPPPPSSCEKGVTAALEAMIAHDEGTASQINNGYGTLVGGTDIERATSP